MHQSRHLVGCRATDINSLLIYFLNALRCLGLLCQVISLNMKNSFGISFIKLASKSLILLQPTLRIPILSLENVELPIIVRE